MPPMWHQFSIADGSNRQCELCDVIADAHIIDDITLECPVAPCPEPANHGEPCVFVVTPEGPECAYCARPGNPDEREESADWAL